MAAPDQPEVSATTPAVAEPSPNHGGTLRLEATGVTLRRGLCYLKGGAAAFIDSERKLSHKPSIIADSIIRKAMSAVVIAIHITALWKGIIFLASSAVDSW